MTPASLEVSKLASVNHACDRIPIVSTFTNATHLIAKGVFNLRKRTGHPTENNPYHQYLQNKENSSMGKLLIPGFGNVWIIRRDNKIKREEHAFKEKALSFLENPPEKYANVMNTPLPLLTLNRSFREDLKKWFGDLSKEKQKIALSITSKSGNTLLHLFSEEIIPLIKGNKNLASTWLSIKNNEGKTPLDLDIGSAHKLLENCTDSKLIEILSSFFNGELDNILFQYLSNYLLNLPYEELIKLKKCHLQASPNNDNIRPYKPQNFTYDPTYRYNIDWLKTRTRSEYLIILAILDEESHCEKQIVPLLRWCTPHLELQKDFKYIAPYLKKVSLEALSKNVQDLPTFTDLANEEGIDFLISLSFEEIMKVLSLSNPGLLFTLGSHPQAAHLVLKLIEKKGLTQQQARSLLSKQDTYFRTFLNGSHPITRENVTEYIKIIDILYPDFLNERRNLPKNIITSFFFFALNQPRAKVADNSAYEDLANHAVRQIKPLVDYFCKRVLDEKWYLFLPFLALQTHAELIEFKALNLSFFKELDLTLEDLDPSTNPLQRMNQRVTAISEMCLHSLDNYFILLNILDENSLSEEEILTLLNAISYIPTLLERISIPDFFKSMLPYLRKIQASSLSLLPNFYKKNCLPWLLSLSFQDLYLLISLPSQLGFLFGLGCEPEGILSLHTLITEKQLTKKQVYDLLKIKDNANRTFFSAEPSTDRHLIVPYLQLCDEFLEPEDFKSLTETIPENIKMRIEEGRIRLLAQTVGEGEFVALLKKQNSWHLQLTILRESSTFLKLAFLNSETCKNFFIIQKGDEVELKQLERKLKSCLDLLDPLEGEKWDLFVEIEALLKNKREELTKPKNTLLESEEEVPLEYQDPITFEVMENPYTLTDIEGNTINVDYSTIQNSILPFGSLHPVTQLPLQTNNYGSLMIKENEILRKEISDFSCTLEKIT